MPEAPPCPQILLRIGFLWNCPHLGGEKPEMALKAYDRVVAEYASRHKEVIHALTGQAYCYWLMKKPDKALERAQALMDYRLPDSPDKDLLDSLANAQRDMGPHLAMYLMERDQGSPSRPPSGPAALPASRPSSSPGSRPDLPAASRPGEGSRGRFYSPLPIDISDVDRFVLLTRARRWTTFEDLPRAPREPAPPK